MASDTTPMLKVMLERADISAQVYRVDVEDVDRGADKATFVMQDPGSTNSDGLQEGMAVRIELGWETEYALAFVGRIRAVRSLASSSGHQRVEATCTDMSILFMSRPEIEERQHVGPLRDILSAMATRVGIALGDVVIDPMPTFTQDRPLNQRDRTDWQMLQDLAEEYRARAFIEVSAKPTDSDAVREAGGEPKLFFVSEQALIDQEPMGTLVYCRGMGRLLDFNYTRVGSGASPAAATAVANPDSGEPETRETPPADPDAETAPSAARSDQAVDVLGEARAADHAAAVQNAQDAPVQPADQRAAQIVAGLPSDPALAERLIQQDRTRILGFQGRGTAMGTVFLRAKGSVEIEGISSTAAGRWYLSRVNHVIERQAVRRTARRQQTRLTYRTMLVATR